jgi:hypothetical protein
MSRKTQPEKSKLVNRLLKFMDDGDLIFVGKLDGKVFSNFIQVDKLAPDVTMELFRRAADDLVLLGRKYTNQIDSHDDNV